MKIALYIITGLLVFLAAATGMFFLMPVIAPDRVQATQTASDTLAATVPDSTEIAASFEEFTAENFPNLDLFADSAVVASDLAVTEEALRSGLRHVRGQINRLESMIDSLVVLRAEANRIAAEAQARAEAQAAQAAAQVPATAAQAAAATQAQQQQIDEMATAIGRMEDDALRSLIAQMDDASLTRLYTASTGRNRTRILAAIPPERAARFVRSLIIPAN